MPGRVTKLSPSNLIRRADHDSSSLVSSPGMKSRILVLTIAALVAAHAQSSTVVAKIGDLEINAAEIRETLAGLDDTQQAAVANDPAALGQYVRALIVQRLVLRQALDRKWDQDPAVISRLVRARESVLTESFLQEQSAPEAGYPSDKELTGAYEANKSKLLIPRGYQLAQIFIAGDQAKLDATVKQLKAPKADFAAIARAQSEEPASAANGGEIGWLTEDQIQPEIRAKLPALKLGLVSDPIRLNDGWHILKVLDTREARTPTLSEIRDRLTAELKAERARLKREQYLAALLKAHPPAINEIELGKILAKP
jgi:parvulin-like peptidyl-prolyl isomerase